MSNTQVISAADLRTIERNLQGIYQYMNDMNSRIDTVNANVYKVDQHVGTIYSELGKLAQEFKQFIKTSEMQHNLAVAETRIVKIRQELEKKFGYYAQVRRTTTGILQADDIGIVKKDTISNASEELMLTAPNYWLAPCLVALSAWISNNPQLTERALREGLKRNDEKTSLLFGLICRRAGRKQACMRWIQRYLANQDERELDRKAIVILDAFASGLFGADTEGIVSRQMTEWMDRLTSEPGFTDKQIQNWEDAINRQRKVYNEAQYPGLRQFSSTWPALKDVMEGAVLHTTIYEYFVHIFEQQVELKELKVQVDRILTSLVSDFDDEELPLKKEEKKNQLIIDFKGDNDLAEQRMQEEEHIFDTRKNFAQLLTDAAMNPEESHASVSAQKFAITLSKDWIINAYSDLTAKNRLHVPDDIEIIIEDFHAKTADGSNEQEVIIEHERWIEQKKEQALKKNEMGLIEKMLLYLGGSLAVIGIIMTLLGILQGVPLIIAGGVLAIIYFVLKNSTDKKKQKIIETYETLKKNGNEIIRALMAEVVDFRREFAQRDAESQKVLDFLEMITPEQYIEKMAGTSRKIKINQ